MLIQPKAQKFKDKCFTSLEFYSLRDVFHGLADQQDTIKYLKEDTLARYLEIPDILGASPVIFQMVSYLGAFPFLEDAPVILELPQLMIVIILLTERYRKVLAKGSTDRTKLLFRSLAVYDRKASNADQTNFEKEENGSAEKPTSQAAGFAVDQGLDDVGDDDDDDLVLTEFELLDISQAVQQGHAPASHGAMIPSDNFRKLLMLLLLAAPLDAQESLSLYSGRLVGEELQDLRSTADCILSSFVHIERSPGIKYKDFKTIIPVVCPNLFDGLQGLFEHFLFSKNLDFSKHQNTKVDHTSAVIPIAQPLVPEGGEILNSITIAQISLFLPATDLFRRMRLLYSGQDAGFSMGSFESKVFNWQAPTLLLVRGTRLDVSPDSRQESAFADALPTRRFKSGGPAGETVTYGVYIKQHWKHTHRECFGDSDTVLFQLEPVHDVFHGAKMHNDFVAFTKRPSNTPVLSFGCPHPDPAKAHRSSVRSLGPVSLLLDDSFEFGVFNHDFGMPGGAFQRSVVRKHDFQDRFMIDSLEVWGCGGDKEAKAQAERWAWEEREAEARRRINLGTGDIAADRALLEMAGLVGANRSGGSMG